MWRSGDLREAIIWMPKVWLTKATRVGRRRLRAAMIKGIKGLFVKNTIIHICHGHWSNNSETEKE